MYIKCCSNCMENNRVSTQYKGVSWSWSYGSWIYNYLCNRYISPLTLWVRIPPRRSVLDTTLSDKVCQWLLAGRWLSPGTPVSSTKKTTVRHDITEILLKVTLNSINHKPSMIDNYVYIYYLVKTTESGVKHHKNNPHLLHTKALLNTWHGIS